MHCTNVYPVKFQGPLECSR